MTCNTDSSNEFLFETDHLAFNGNKDYQEFLKYILLLECCKSKTIQDIETLSIAKKKALDDPLKFITDLKENNLDFPGLVPIPSIPLINWRQYGLEENQLSEESIHIKNKVIEKEVDRNITVRGRTYHESKPETFNQLWTCEEQRRLEELLQEFPEEEVEMHRWSKIAQALGNRTPKQVMVRVQKYFLKLLKAGLPIPGRAPKSFSSKQGPSSRHNERISKFMQKRSTFFPGQDVPVFMEDIKAESENTGKDALDQWTPAQMLAEVYAARKIEESFHGPLPVHYGTTCVGCQSENIVGVRWTDRVGCNWCSDCIIIYQPSNRLVPVNLLSDQELKNEPLDS